MQLSVCFEMLSFEHASQEDWKVESDAPAHHTFLKGSGPQLFRDHILIINVLLGPEWPCPESAAQAVMSTLEWPARHQGLPLTAEGFNTNENASKCLEWNPSSASR